jgi:predicted butyrate kinase (DUF1464 family)
MRIIGIDPGTGSFDFYGKDGADVILDVSVPVPEVAQRPEILLETLKKVFPLDLIIGPSGYGLPVTPIRDIGEKELTLMVPDDKSIPLYDGIRRVIRLMQQEGYPVRFTPGVIHLPTVPGYRKANKIDMGTADKVCCAALAVRDQAESLGIGYNETSFILIEMGFAFTAAMAVAGGKIIDGIGGTSGGPGFLTLGNMDSELAVRLGDFPGALLFGGGARDMSGKDDLTPEELAGQKDRYSAAWNMLLEGVVKNVAQLTVALPQPREILLSGRLTRVPAISAELKLRLARFAPVRLVNRKARQAKEAAEGAYIIGEGLGGGRYRDLTDGLELNGARGTIYDYVLLKYTPVRAQDKPYIM